MLRHSTISIISTGAGSFIIRASGGQLPSPIFKPGLWSPEAGRALDTAALLSRKHLSGDGGCGTQSNKRNKKARFSHQNHLRRRARTMEFSLSLRSTWKQISLFCHIKLFFKLGFLGFYLKSFMCVSLIKTMRGKGC